ncbi:4716_t:CDS:2 [Gigaspora margarita]|uniref:4716_t:CDS:1 n=1 Tax=Gigaspora margarita TaxID=4874 RepID=A0ABN7UTA9_GIGMA|nr:4716_t:CDS:2 [Gigaspora margarita]
MEESNRLSVFSNSDMANSENHSNYHTYVVSHIVRPSKEYSLIFSSVILILLSILLLLILLLGSSKTIYLSKFPFDESIKYITKKKDIAFTLYSYCLDNSCTTPSLLNNFDKLLSFSEITDKSSNQKCLDIPISSIPTPSIPNVLSSVKAAVSAVSSAVIDASNTAANTAANTAREIAVAAPGLLSELLSAFDNFKPRSPTANFVDIGSQITGPDIYLATISTSFSTAATILLFIDSCNLIKKVRGTKNNVVIGANNFL